MKFKRFVCIAELPTICLGKGQCTQGMSTYGLDINKTRGFAIQTLLRLHFVLFLSANPSDDKSKIVSILIQICSSADAVKISYS